jgi:integrase
MAGIWSVKQQQAQPVGPRPEAPQCDAGEYGITGVSVRFYMPKQRHHMEARSHGYTDWITVPATPDEPATCFAVRLFAYVMATELMLQEDDGLFVTFQTSKLHSGKCWGLSADALANVMGRMMAEAGIPPEFRPHSARHAGQALLKSKGTADADVMARANMSQRTYVTHYMRQIRRVQVFDVAP